MSSVTNVTALIERISGTERLQGPEHTPAVTARHALCWQTPAPRQSRSFRGPGTLPGALEIPRRNPAISRDLTRGIPDAAKKGHSDKEASMEFLSRIMD